MDRWVAERVHDLIAERALLVDVLRVATDLGRPQWLVIASVVVGSVLWWRGRPRAGVLLVAATLGAWVLDVELKGLFDRVRPTFDDPLARSSGPSFPSGHAMVAAAAAIACALVVRRRVVWVGAVAFTIVIAATRVLLGVHWLSDVVVGAVLGAAWAWTCARVLLRGEEDLRPRDREAAEDLPGAPGRDGEAQPR